MALISLAIAVLAAVTAVNAQIGTLGNCDNCFSPPSALVYGSIYFGGSQYGAYSVCSNGYMVLLSSTSDPIRGYSYNPQPISQTEGSPMIAPFWSDVNLACPGTNNTVTYTETNNFSQLATARSLSGDGDFNPTFAVVVEYDAVQSFGCPASRDANNYTIIVVTDSIKGKTYAIFLYQTMSWSRSNDWSNEPTVGYSNGQSQGFQQSFFGNDPASYVQQCGFLLYRVDESFSQQVQAQNRGTLARQQKDEAGRLVMQEFAEKKGENGYKAAMQEKLELALQNAQRENRVILQSFNKKN